MMRPPIPFLAPLLLALPSCLVPTGSQPEVSGGLTALSQYNFRGMVMNEKGAVQPAMGVAVPTDGDGILQFDTMGNMDVSDDTGDAWFPDGHGGRFSEVDYSVLWSKPLGEFDFAVGTEVYVLPNGLEFPFGERGETKELFVNVGRAFGEQYVESVLHYDYDEAEGIYWELATDRAFPLGDRWTATARLSAAYNDDNHAEWTYGLPEGGLADARLTGTATYQWNENTVFEVLAAYSTMLNSEQADWFELIGIEPNNFFIGLGLRWSFGEVSQ